MDTTREIALHCAEVARSVGQGMAEYAIENDENVQVLCTTVAVHLLAYVLAFHPEEKHESLLEKVRTSAIAMSEDHRDQIANLSDDFLIAEAEKILKRRKPWERS